MARKYRIYINQQVLLLTEASPEPSENFQQLDNQNFDLTTIYSHLNDQPAKQGFFILCDDVKTCFKKLKKSVTLIKAAGGLVKNPAGDYLFIYRNDKWDLPKGKLEKGEKKKDGAVREVEEECGIKVGTAGKKIVNTYHVYVLKGQPVLKKTFWYAMGYEGTGMVKPQVEEGITEVRWFNHSHMAAIKHNTFPSIMEVLKKVGLLTNAATPLPE